MKAQKVDEVKTQQRKNALKKYRESKDRLVELEKQIAELQRPTRQQRNVVGALEDKIKKWKSRNTRKLEDWVMNSTGSKDERVARVTKFLTNGLDEIVIAYDKLITERSDLYMSERPLKQAIKEMETIEKRLHEMETKKNMHPSITGEGYVGRLRRTKFYKSNQA